MRAGEQNRPVLTISLLISNRPDTIRKSLDSLKPLMEQVPSELILVDTSGVKEIHDLLTEYTDRVLDFTWCNDFSKARNVGLKEARGEWFLYVDDDEWFEDVSPVIAFFQSGSYHGYHQAVYRQRNYRNAEGTEFQDIWASRMIRLEADTRFEGCIHEVLSPVTGKTAAIDCFVHHYGYVFAGEKERKAHAERNITLLLQMIQREPEEMRWRTHLLKEYDMCGDYASLGRTAEEALQKLKRREDDEAILQRGTFYTAVLMADQELEQYEAFQTHFEEYIGDERNTNYVKCSLYKLAALVAQAREDFAQADAYARLYFEAYDNYRREEKDEQQRLLEECTVYVRDNVSDQIVNFMRALWATVLIFSDRAAEFPEKQRRAYQEYLERQQEKEGFQVPQYVKLMEQAGLVSLKKNEENSRPVLTISLLVSNRPDTIRKSLDSLKPIMEQIPSELVLVDTSGVKEIHDILTEYTDRVLDFTWCNDFSKARNVGLKAAKGEWFLYLDDDEWFVETDELVDFFRSGEYRKYHRANYIQRNFQDALLVYYSDSWVSRMIRIEPDTHFESRIHEYMAPARGLSKNIRAVANHTGYIFQTEEDKLRHFERNSELLLEMMKEEPGRLRWQVQLAQEYRSVKKWDELYTFCKECLASHKGEDAPGINRDVGTFYVGAVEALLFLGENEKAEETAKKGIADKRMSRLCRSHLLLQLGVAYYRMERFQESEQVLAEYLSNYEYMQAHEDEWNEQQGVLLVEEAFDEVSVKKAYSILCCDGLKQKDTSYLKQYYPKLDWGKRVIYVCDDFPPALLEAMGTMPEEEIFASVWRDAWNNTELRAKFTEYVNDRQAHDMKAYEQLLRVISVADIEQEYTLSVDLILTVKEGDLKWLDRGMLKKPRPFLEQVIPGVLEPLSTGALENLEKMCEDYTFSDELRGTLLVILLRQCILLRGENGGVYAKLRKQMEEFSGYVLEFLSRYYKPAALEEYPEVLPRYGQTALALSRALQKEADDPSGALKGYREVVTIDSRYADVITYYMRLFGEAKNAEARQAQEELKALKENVLKEVSDLAKNHAYAAALEILSELKRTLPDDLETAQKSLEIRLLLLQEA